MDILQRLFLDIFSFVYPIVYSPLVSYILVFLLFAYLAWVNWGFIRKLHSKKKFSKQLLKYGLVALEIFLILFLAWYVLIHFKTVTVFT